MSDHTDSQIADLVQQITVTIQQAKSFAAGQAPDVVNQIINYHYAMLVAGIIGGFALLILAVLFGKRTQRLIDQGRCEELQLPFYAIGSFIAAGFGPLLIISSAIELTQLTIAPKVWLIEYAAGLIHH